MAEKSGIIAGVQAEPTVTGGGGGIPGLSVTTSTCVATSCLSEFDVQRLHDLMEKQSHIYQDLVEKQSAAYELTAERHQAAIRSAIERGSALILDFLARGAADSSMASRLAVAAAAAEMKADRGPLPLPRGQLPPVAPSPPPSPRLDSASELPISPTHGLQNQTDQDGLQTAKPNCLRGSTSDSDSIKISAATSSKIMQDNTATMHLSSMVAEASSTGNMLELSSASNIADVSMMANWSSESSLDVGDALFEDGTTKHGARWSKKNMHRFDMLMGGFVILNACVMFAQLHWTGTQLAERLGLRSEGDDQTWRTFFVVAEHAFNLLFLMEVILRTVLQGFLHHIREISNAFDAFIVLATSIDAYILEPLQVGGGQNLTFLRLARCLRIVRVLRVARVAKLFFELRVLVKTFFSSIYALMWSMVLLFVVLVCNGIFLAQALGETIANEEANYDTRLWLFENFGDAWKATYFLFEITFSGGWPVMVRPLLERVNSAWVAYWVLYIAVVHFAMLRVVAALFLRETLNEASRDAEMMVMEKLKQKEKYAKNLMSFFHEADNNKDGCLTSEEFQYILRNPKVKTWLQVLELEVHEVNALFHLLDDGDGLISFEEFLQGAIRLKGNARSVDAIAILHEQNRLTHRLKILQGGFDQLFKVLNIEKRSISNLTDSAKRYPRDRGDTILFQGLEKPQYTTPKHSKLAGTTSLVDGADN